MMLDKVCLFCALTLMSGSVEKLPLNRVEPKGFDIVKEQLFNGLQSNKTQNHASALKSNENIKKFLSSLSSEDRFVLDHFFRCLIQEDTVGYVLLGAKPMCVYGYSQLKKTNYSISGEPVEQLDLFFDGFNEKDALFHKGWEIWKKHAHRFCGENIVFDFFEENRELHSMKVIVVNKRLMLPLLDQHFSQFARLDPSVENKEALFEALLHNESFKKKFYSCHDLLGISLGFGAKNAHLFQKMIYLFNSMGWFGETLGTTTSPDRLHRLEREWSTLKTSFNAGMQDHVSRKLGFHYGVGFRADFSDPETIRLQKKYSDCYKKITRAYSKGNFLEKTLELIQVADSSPLN